MGCACFRQKIIINSKIKGNEEENIDEYDDINNINTNYNDNINNDNQNNINMINSDNYISSSSNNIRIDSSNNLENNDSNHSNHINIDNNNNTSYIFSTFEPYLQSKYNEYFNFPEIQNEKN